MALGPPGIVAAGESFRAGAGGSEEEPRRRGALDSAPKGASTLTRSRPILPAAGTALALAAALAAPGCRAAPVAPYDLERCRLTLSLAPAEHLLTATAELTLAVPGEAGATPPPLRLELLPQLTIREMEAGGKAVEFRRSPPEEGAAASREPGADGGTKRPPPALYAVDWSPPGGRGTLTVRYDGPLVEDVAAGEKPGKIHNFEVRAHVGPEGIYLSEEVPWYPRPAAPEPDGAGGPETDLADFEVTAAAVPGMVLVASGDRDGAALGVPRGESTTWRSPFPFPGVTLAGGPHEVHERQVGPVLVSAQLAPESASFAAPLLDAVAHYLALYVPRLGPYPYREFSVVENFFSSGFALPGYTLLASAVIRMGERGLRPGYLDHEMLHNWWGNGVFVSARDGNWCEGLATYTGNYQRKVLEGDLEGARRHRRDAAQGLSRLLPDEDKPLATFGRDGGANRLIGYEKGAMVFDQLAGVIGQETVWRALARFFRDNRGRLAGWAEIERAAEAESGRDLAGFFAFWVRGSGLPEIRLRDAVFDPAKGELEVGLSRTGGDGLAFEVPLRLVGAAGGEDEERSVELSGDEVTAALPTAAAPRAVELDPDYRLLRRVPPELLMPTLGGIRPGRPLVIVRAAGDLPDYDVVAQEVRDRYADGPADQVREVDSGALTTADLARGHALLLGRAARAEAVRALLDGSPLALTDSGFAVDGQPFEQPDQAVLACLRNRSDPGGVLCLYLGNSQAALGNARLVTFYGNSLLVFTAGTPTLRRDFDAGERVEVTVLAKAGGRAGSR